jgi:hypothetical protein
MLDTWMNLVLVLSRLVQYGLIRIPLITRCLSQLLETFARIINVKAEEFRREEIEAVFALDL